MSSAETALAELLGADLSGLDLVALMVDGVHFAGHCCVVAVGIAIDGTKHPLGVVEGSTENATLVTELIIDLRERGPRRHQADPGRDRRVQGPATGRARRVRSCPDPSGANSTVRLTENLEQHLPDSLAATVATKMRAAYHSTDPLAAEAELESLATQLAKAHPGAAASLREGLAETLTIGRLGVPPTLARTLRSTNAIESMVEIRRVNGFMHLPALRTALEAHFAKGTVTGSKYNREKEVAA